MRLLHQITEVNSVIKDKKTTLGSSCSVIPSVCEVRCIPAIIYLFDVLTVLEPVIYFRLLYSCFPQQLSSGFSETDSFQCVRFTGLYLQHTAET